MSLHLPKLPPTQPHGPFIGPTPRANKLYGRLMVSWGVLSAVVMFAGVLLAFSSKSGFLPAAYPALAVLMVSLFLPEKWEKAKSITRTVFQIMLGATLIYLIAAEPSIGLVLFAVGFAAISIPYGWMSVASRRILSRFGYEVKPLSEALASGSGS